MKSKSNQSMQVRPIFMIALALVIGLYVGNNGLLTRSTDEGNVEGANTGFNEFGYNYGARAFVGPADGTDKNLDGTVWGDPTYAKDHLVMKWNDKWNDCNEVGNNSVEQCLGAWTTNVWNGMMPDGSRSNWHYKIIWVGSAAEASPYWVNGGYSIWGNYEVIADKGTDINGHQVYAHGVPNGL